MKKAIILILALAAAASCTQGPEQKVMARFVPERADDFIFENDLICGRFYGKALEGNPTSPGIDIWVKTPGELVANQRYKDELENGLSYHIDRGNGKDCYKVAVSLGGGASSPIVDGALCLPPTNYREWEIVSEEPGKVVFTLRYPAWQAGQASVSLSKTITVTAGTYWCDVEDVYSFEGAETLDIAAGFIRHDITEETSWATGMAIWEHASDQSVEPEDGMIGVAVRMEEPDAITLTADGAHSVAVKRIHNGQSVHYSYASCWSKGDIKTAGDWFAYVTE